MSICTGPKVAYNGLTLLGGRRVGWDLHVGDLVDHLVADGGDELFDPGFAGALSALGENHIIALAPFRHHFADEPGRILHVDVHHDDGLAGRVLHACQRRHGLAKATGKFEQLDALVSGARLENDLLGAIGRGVDGKDDFVFFRDSRQHRSYAPQEFRDVLFLAIDREHE